MADKPDLILTGEGRFDDSSLSGKGPGAVAARADDVDGIEPGRQMGLASQRAHGAGKAAHFLRRDALGPQCGQQGTRHGRRHASS